MHASTDLPRPCSYKARYSFWPTLYMQRDVQCRLLLTIFYHSSTVRLNESIIIPAKSFLFSGEVRYFYNRTDKGGPMKLQQAAVHA